MARLKVVPFPFHSSASISSLPRSFRFSFYLRRLLDSYSRDAVAFQLFNRVAPAFVFERLAQRWDMLQARQNESRQGFESDIARQNQPVLRFEVTNIHRSFQNQHRLI